MTGQKIYMQFSGNMVQSIANAEVLSYQHCTERIIAFCNSGRSNEVHFNLQFINKSIHSKIKTYN